jgi:ketosteroid isomerase-like protein
MKALFASFVLGDNAGVMELVHPDGVWFFPGDPAILPWAGTWPGRDFEEFMERCKDALDYLEYTIKEFLPVDGERVVVVCRERCRVKATGKVCDNEHIGVATIRDGLVYSWHEYADTAAFHAAFDD